jgi:malonate-semialdehyde dehydrogenase (acetylating)/methylmalonate-semialdehyde dehydrogenase
MSTLRIGDPLDKNTDIGAINSAEQLAKIRELSDIGEREGAGRWSPPCELPDHGFWFPPTIFTGVSQAHRIAREEIFGPVLSVVRVDDVDAAIALINSNPYGNGTAIFTSSGEAARRFQRGVNVGMIGINVPVPVPMAFYSFGGWKDSLFGDKHIHGPEGVSFYTRAKVVTARWPRPSHASEASFHFPTAK